MNRDCRTTVFTINKYIVCIVYKSIIYDHFNLYAVNGHSIQYKVQTTYEFIYFIVYVYYRV